MNYIREPGRPVYTQQAQFHKLNLKKESYLHSKELHIQIRKYSQQYDLEEQTAYNNAHCAR